MSTQSDRELIEKVRKLWDDCDLILTSKQMRYLETIFDLADEGHYHMLPNTRDFVEKCAMGFYSEESWT